MLILPGFRSVTSVLAGVHNSNLYMLASVCYPSIYFVHMPFHFFLSSHSSILWVQSVLVLSAALMLSLPVRCHNSFPDSFVLPLWHIEKLQQELEHARHQHSLQISSPPLHFRCQWFVCRHNKSEGFRKGMFTQKIGLISQYRNTPTLMHTISHILCHTFI